MREEQQLHQQDSVERARELELTEELVAVREENLQLMQQLSVVNSQLDSEERGVDAQLKLQQQVEEQATMVTNQQQALSAAQEQMKAAGTQERGGGISSLSSSSSRNQQVGS